jgi:hypothetical protein
VHEPVDGAVVLGDGEQVGDADEDDEQVAGEEAEDRVVVRQLLVEAVDEVGGDEGRHQRQRAHVHRAAPWR